MKPRLRYIDKLWCCNVEGEDFCGYGYTPLQAYDEWLQMAWAAAQERAA